jgi:hypothetical protein
MKIEIPKDRNLPVRIIREPGDKEAGPGRAGESKEKKNWYVRIPRTLTRRTMKDLNPTERLTLLLLMSYEGKEKLICPSLRTLAGEIGIGLSWVWKIIKKLEKEKYIKITKEKGKYNTYKMLF